MMPFYFEVREGEAVVEKIPISTKGHYLIGRLPMCDILVDGMRVEIRGKNGNILLVSSPSSSRCYLFQTACSCTVSTRRS